jgi:hypothetical protein
VLACSTCISATTTGCTGTAPALSTRNPSPPRSQSRVLTLQCRRRVLAVRRSPTSALRIARPRSPTPEPTRFRSPNSRSTPPAPRRRGAPVAGGPSCLFGSAALPSPTSFASAPEKTHQLAPARIPHTCALVRRSFGSLVHPHSIASFDAGAIGPCGIFPRMTPRVIPAELARGHPPVDLTLPQRKLH